MKDVRARVRAALIVGAVAVTTFVVAPVPASAGQAGPTRPQAAGPVTTTPPAPAAGSRPTRPAPPTTAVVPATGSPAAGSGTAPVPADPGAPLPLPPGITADTPPEPHVVAGFAGELKGPRRTAAPGPGLSVPVRSDVDGCDRNYGEASQCVPRTLPRGQADLCAYLAQRGLRGVRLKGGDTKGVDGNRNGVACD